VYETDQESKEAISALISGRTTSSKEKYSWNPSKFKEMGSLLRGGGTECSLKEYCMKSVQGLKIPSKIPYAPWRGEHG
jgi:hypothetical protein